MPQQKLTNKSNKILVMTILALAAVAVVSVWPAGNINRMRQVNVTGECIAMVEQDRTSTTLRVTVRDRNSGQSMARARATYSIISEYVNRIKASDPSLEAQTARFDSDRRTRWDHSMRDNVFDTYETNIELRLSSEDRAVIEGMLSHFAGMENVLPGRLSMYVSNKKMKAAIEDCIKEAAIDAREKADAVARAGGARVGQLMSASFHRTTGGGGGITPRGMMMSAMAMDEAMPMGAAGGGVELFSADSQISITVHAAFGLR
jgi:uncharacterized protein YggE